MSKVYLFSPAKINLGLRVGAKSYSSSVKSIRHSIRTIMLPISWGDKIHLNYELSPEQLADQTAQCFSPIRWVTKSLLTNKEQMLAFAKIAAPHGEETYKNLICKIMCKIDYSLCKQLAIHLHKQIPLGGGLGGGSSNAGVLLRYLYENRNIFSLMNNTNYSQLARELGSDVSYFFKCTGDDSHTAALVSNAGEKLRKIKLAPAYGILCLAPFMISTAWAYKTLNRPLLEKTDQTQKIESSFMDWPSTQLLTVLQQKSWLQLDRDFLREQFVNDFEDIVFAKYPQLKKIKQDFNNIGAVYASLCGSGASMFAIVQGREQQNQLVQEMQTQHSDFRFISFRMLV